MKIPKNKFFICFEGYNRALASKYYNEKIFIAFYTLKAIKGKRF
jgi:hypothetical protein